MYADNFFQRGQPDMNPIYLSSYFLPYNEQWMIMMFWQTSMARGRNIQPLVANHTINQMGQTDNAWGILLGVKGEPSSPVRHGEWILFENT